MLRLLSHSSAQKMDSGILESQHQHGLNAWEICLLQDLGGSVVVLPPYTL